jgi:hypothetical protein
VFKLQGELVANSQITHDFEATVFDWHPVDRLLAIGWGDGETPFSALYAAIG